MKTAKKALLSAISVIVVLISFMVCSCITSSAEEVSVNATGASQTYICGDVNLDGEISIQDATLAQMYMASLKTLDDTQIKLADCDTIVGVQVTDVTWIQMYIAKIAVDFPSNKDGYKVGDVVTISTKAVLMKGEDFNKAI